MVGFPHLVNLNYGMMLDDYFSIALGGGGLALSLPLQGKTYSAGIYNGDLRARLHPFGGAFFIGGAFGYQRLTASASETFTVSSLSIPTTVSGVMNSLFLTPHLGWLWGAHESGLFFGIEAGVMIPLSPSSTVNVTSSNSLFETVLTLLEALPSYKTLQSKLQTSINQVGTQQLPYANITIGVAF
jgi:hypothetical protein